jgi:hypothetical protein
VRIGEDKCLSHDSEGKKLNGPMGLRLFGASSARVIGSHVLNGGGDSGSKPLML